MIDTTNTNPQMNIEDYIGAEILASSYEGDRDTMFILVKDTTGEGRGVFCGIGVGRYSPSEFAAISSFYGAVRFAGKVRDGIKWAASAPGCEREVADHLDDVPIRMSAETILHFKRALQADYAFAPTSAPAADEEQGNARGVITKLENGETLVTLLLPA